MTQVHRLRNRACGLLLACSLGFLLAAASASAAPGPRWEVFSFSNSAAAPGTQVAYEVIISNGGDLPTDEAVPTTVTVHLPPGMEALRGNLQGVECDPVITPEVAYCRLATSVPPLRFLKLELTARVASTATGTLTPTFEVAGGGASASVASDPIRISSATTPFGIEGFDAFATGDQEGVLSTQAAAHPRSFDTSFAINKATLPQGPLGDQANWPVESIRDVFVDLPPGFVGNPTLAPTCSLADLAASQQSVPKSLCPSESQLGLAQIGINTGALPAPIFNMIPPPGVPARFGMNLFGTPITLDAEVRSGADYGITVVSRYTPQGVPTTFVRTRFWGVPADPANESHRACPGEFAPPFGSACSSTAERRPFFRNPTSCSPMGRGLPYSISANSWENPADFATSAAESHEAPGFPLDPDPAAGTPWGSVHGTDGCAVVPFDPAVSVSPTTDHADSPSGLDFQLTVPQQCWEGNEVDSICQSDLRDASVTLPQGLTLNPSAAAGLGACTEAQVGYKPGTAVPYEFTPDPAACPGDSKLGEVAITTPLLDDPLEGSVYLAAQQHNPTGTLLGIYLVAEGSGVVVKQAGAITSDSDTGRLTTTFEGAPQTPFSYLELRLFGGPRAPLRTPPACGTYSATAALGPWSAVDPETDQIPAAGVVHRQSSFTIDQGCGTGTFDPQLQAGTQNPLAGAYSPFHLRLSRDDGTDPIAGLQVKLPRGLLANLGSVSYCSDAALAAISKDLGTGAGQVNSPACPAASQVGTVTVGAGAGPNPFYTDLGRVYWAGPYKGAPVSLAAVVPAVAGPFDLGTEVVRNGIHVDPDTAELTVKADPLPMILHGIPLDLRDVRVDVTRLNYTLNPTNCESMSVEGLLSSTTGATAARSSHFQVGGCDRLGFKPRLSFRFKGPVHRRAHPSLTAVYKARPGDANLARAQVKLPPAAFLDNAHIGTICTRVQFAAHACPEGSIYGRAKATSPILGYPLYGNVYLRSSNNELPDLVADLRGPDTQPIEVALAGRTDSVKGALRNTFELVPDAPVTEFRLTLFGKSKGLIIMSSGFCANPKATVKLDAHNGKVRDTNPVVRSKCSGDKKRRK